MRILVRFGLPLAVLLACTPVSAGFDTDTLANDQLHPGEGLQSENGEYRFKFEKNGLLAIYHKEKDRWVKKKSTGSQQGVFPLLVMQAEGNLCVYNVNPEKEEDRSQWKLIWQSRTVGPMRTLVMQDDGHLCIYDKNHKWVWGLKAK